MFNDSELQLINMLVNVAFKNGEIDILPVLDVPLIGYRITAEKDNHTCILELIAHRAVPGVDGRIDSGMMFYHLKQILKNGKYIILLLLIFLLPDKEMFFQMEVLY